MWWFALAIAVCGGCGRLGFDPIGDDGTGGGDFSPTREIYLKASNPDAADRFGSSVAISADGNTLAIGAPGEASAATGIDGNQADNSVPSAGAVYVFVRVSGMWVQEAYVKPAITDADLFGSSIALSADGNVLAIGAPNEDSNATGVNGNAADNSLSDSGAVYVFTRATSWAQAAYIKASNTGAGDLFGISVALASDGRTLVVGASGEDSGAVGVGGNEADNSASKSGAVYVFTGSGAAWAQAAYIKASNSDASDQFGKAVTVAGDGNLLAVGVVHEASAATGIDGNQADNSAPASGAAYVFVRTGETWAQQTYIKASNAEMRDNFGSSVALAADASTLAVGADSESSAAVGIDGNQTDNTAAVSGAIYLFTRTGATWNQAAYLKASNTGAGDRFGESVSLSTTGDGLAVGAPSEASAATGIAADQTDNSMPGAGASYVASTGASSARRAYLKASNTDSNDNFGFAVALSDERTLAVGAIGEASAAKGIGGDQSDNTKPGAGAVYVFQ